MTDDTIPAPHQLRRARTIGLFRLPASDAARSLTADIATRILPSAAQGARPVGLKGARRHHDEVGAILGGLLRAHFRTDLPVAANRRPGAAMWSGKPPIGNRAFWSKVDRLTACGLIGQKNGIQKPQDGATGRYGGAATVLWPSEDLLAVAASRGLSETTVDIAWPFNRTLEASRIAVPTDDLVTMTMLPPVDEQGKRVRGDTPRMVVPIDHVAAASSMRRDVQRLNEHVASALIEGCRAPVFQRTFKGDIRLHGRLYALGNENYQSGLGKAERRALRINGEPAAEVDLSASFLTIFLAQTGIVLPEGDPYGLVAAPRDAVKAFLVQSFGAGKLGTRWAEGTDKNITRLGSPKAIRMALLAAFPALGDIPAILPADLARTLPAGLHGWAAGQHLTFLESQVVMAAVLEVMAAGVVALPLHDALVVPLSEVEAARAALVGAFSAAFGVRPVVRVKDVQPTDTLSENGTDAVQR